MRCASDAARVALRIAGAIGGGYACTALAVAVGAALLARAGMARSEAVALMAMLGFPLYLGVLLWSFAVRRLRALWLVLAVTAGALALARAALG